MVKMATRSSTKKGSSFNLAFLIFLKLLYHSKSLSEIKPLSGKKVAGLAFAFT